MTLHPHRCIFGKHTTRENMHLFQTMYAFTLSIKLGGVYLDTDVELLKSLDGFLEHEMFVGFENDTGLSTGIIGACKGHFAIKHMMNEYNEISFYTDNKKSFDFTTNGARMKEYFLKLGLILNNRFQQFENITVYPKDYFSPMKAMAYTLHLTENSCAIHYFNFSWWDDQSRKNLKRLRFKSKYDLADKRKAYVHNLIKNLPGEKAIKRIKKAIRK